MARGLRGRGHRQAIAAPPGSGLETKARTEGFEIAPVSAAGLRAHLKNAQIAHAHTGRAQTLAWAASVGLPLKRVATRHVAFAPRHPLVHRIKYTQLCDGIIAVSEASRQAAVNAGIPESRITVIPTGVEIRPLPTKHERAAARAQWQLEDGDFAAGHLGAFTHEKGQDVAAEALRLLRDRMPHLRMILAGDGPARAGLRPSPHLTLPGHVENPAALLDALDLFLMPSRSEGWGLAALEAMAAGLPVIASNTGGLAEIVEDGKTGWLIPPADAAALADAIAGAESDREESRRRGLFGRDRAGRFSVEETARLTEEFYLRVLA